MNLSESNFVANNLTVSDFEIRIAIVNRTGELCSIHREGKWVWKNISGKSIVNARAPAEPLSELLAALVNSQSASPRAPR